MAEDFSGLDLHSAQMRRDFWQNEYCAASADGDTDRIGEALARVRRLNWLVALMESSNANGVR
jgi:hypothetical protein